MTRNRFLSCLAFDTRRPCVQVLTLFFSNSLITRLLFTRRSIFLDSPPTRACAHARTLSMFLPLLPATHRQAHFWFSLSAFFHFPRCKSPPIPPFLSHIRDHCSPGLFIQFFSLLPLPIVLVFSYHPFMRPFLSPFPPLFYSISHRALALSPLSSTFFAHSS